MRRWVLALLGFALSQGAMADPSAYVCTVQKSAGLHYDGQTKEWEPKSFEAGKKYVLRRVTDQNEKESRYGSLLKLDRGRPNWVFLDGEMPIASCSEDVSIVAFSQLMCHPIIATVDFDKVSRRFEVSYHGAFVSQVDKRRGDVDHPDDVFVAIGTCTPDR